MIVRKFVGVLSLPKNLETQSIHIVSLVVAMSGAGKSSEPPISISDSFIYLHCAILNMVNNLPNIKIDSVLAQFGLQEGAEIPTSQVNKAMWVYIKKHDLKVAKKV